MHNQDKDIVHTIPIKSCANAIFKNTANQSCASVSAYMCACVCVVSYKSGKTHVSPCFCEKKKREKNAYLN